MQILICNGWVISFIDFSMDHDSKQIVDQIMNRMVVVTTDLSINLKRLLLNPSQEE
jgi:hypothetical protein